MFSLEDIQASENADELLLATDQVIADWRSITINDDTAFRFRNGSRPEYAEITANTEEELFRVYNASNKFLGLGRVADGRLETVRLIGGQLNNMICPRQKVRKGQQALHEVLQVHRRNDSVFF